YGLIPAGGGEATAVRTEGHAQDPTRVPFEGAEVLLAEALEIIPLEAAQAGIAGIHLLELLEIPEPLLDQAHLAGFRVEAGQLQLRGIIAPVAQQFGFPNLLLVILR